jgi:redox-sensitive bicupin YhaK (pirin superfamily)
LILFGCAPFQEGVKERGNQFSPMACFLLISLPRVLPRATKIWAALTDLELKLAFQPNDEVRDDESTLGERKMITVRKSEERRHITDENQTTWMTFDQENEADPLQNGFGSLKIFNEEILPPGRGFILHTRKDMVVVTYVREGMIVFKGLSGKPDLVAADEFHRVNLPSDTKLSAFDMSPAEPTHVFQSGFTPGKGPLELKAKKKLFTLAERKGILKLIASPDGKESSLKLQQDVEMYSTLINKGNHMIHEMKPGRNAWLHVVKGRIEMNELQLRGGDGAGFSDEMSVSFTALEPTEILLFDLGEPVPDEIRTGLQSKLAAVTNG